MSKCHPAATASRGGTESPSDKGKCGTCWSQVLCLRAKLRIFWRQRAILHLGLHIQLEGKGSASWRARVERWLIRFRVRMAGRLRARLLGQRSPISCCLRWPQMQSAGQIRCTGGKELQPDLAGLDELGNVLPKKRVCRRRPSKPQPGLSRNINFREAIRRFERVSKIPRGNSTTTSGLAWSMHFQVESPGRKSEKMPAQFDELATGKYVARLQSENLKEPSTHAFSTQADKSGPPNGSAGLPRASTAR